MLVKKENCGVPSLFEGIFGSNFLDSFFDNNYWLNRNLDSYEQGMASSYFDDEKKEHCIVVQVPGFKKEDIEIEVNHQGISLKGEIKDESIKKRIGSKKFHYEMKKYGIDSKSVNAELKDGILNVKFKIEKEKNSRTIEIK